MLTAMRPVFESEWFYWSDGVSRWSGRNELRRLSKWICRQRRLTVLGFSFFYGRQEVALELIEEWATTPPPLPSQMKERG